MREIKGCGRICADRIIKDTFQRPLTFRRVSSDSPEIALFLCLPGVVALPLSDGALNTSRPIRFQSGVVVSTSTQRVRVRL